MPDEGRKISQLTPASSIADTDLIPKENAAGTSTEAATAAQLANYFKSKGVQVDDTLSTPGAAADAAKTGAEVADLKNALIDSNAGKEIFSLYSPFVRGTIENGEYNQWYTFRIVSANIIVFDRDLHITIANGFKVGFAVYVDGVYSSLITWKTGTFTLPANTAVKPLIARVTENNQETADINEFVSKITFSTTVFEIQEDAEYIPQLVEATTGKETIYNGIYKYTSYIASIWDTTLIPSSYSNVSFQIQSVTGRIGTPDHYCRVIAYYTDNTYQIFGYIDQLEKPLICYANENKTVSYWAVELYAATAAQSSDFTTNWNIIALGIPAPNDKGNIPPAYERMMLQDKNPAFLAGKMFGPVSKQYEAISTTENWVGASWVAIDNIPVNGEKYLYAIVLSRHGLGLAMCGCDFYASASDTEPTTSINLNAKEAYSGGTVYSQIIIPSGTAKVTVTFFGISNAQAASETSVIGEEYYINDCYVYLTDTLVGETMLNSEWDSTLDTLRKEQGDSLCFGIQTDTHFALESSVLIGTQLKDATKYVGFDFIANLGDITRGYSGGTNYDNPDNMRVYAKEIMKRYTDGVRCPFLVTVGNHESNIAWETDHPTDDNFSLSELYAQYIRQSKNTFTRIEGESGKNYYYVDLPSARIICLHTNDSEEGGFTVSQAQVNWFTNTALNTSKPVLVLAHVPLIDGWNPDNLNYSADYANIITPLEAFKNNGGVVIACIYGHAHRQEAQKRNGIWHIICTKTESFPTTAEFFMVDLNTYNITTIGVGNAQSRSFIH